jgi:peptide/nickel transport system permease protein
MLRYVAKRVLIMIPTILIISALVFFIINLPPGDCVTSQIEELLSQGSADATAKADQLRHLYGLDRPLWLQYVHWVTGIVFHGSFGLSCQDQLPVTQLIGERIALTMVMEISTIIFIWVVSFIIGVYAATHQYRTGDYVASFIGFIGLATPNFLLALVLLYVGKVYLGISIGGLMDPEFIDKPISWAKVTSVLQHLLVPVIVIGTSGTAGMIRRLRANLLDELQKQYVVTGRAKGLPPLKLLVKYPLRHAMNPFVADIGNILPEVISGSVIVSVVLSLPTTGPMLLNALKTQDTNLAATFLLFVASLTVVGTLVSDLLLAALDPRIRFGAKGEK